MSQEALEFDAAFVEIPVKINNPDKTVSHYLLRELGGEGRDQYLNTTITRANLGSDGKVSGVKDLTDYQATLLVRCLYCQNIDGTAGDPVDIKVLRAWPSRIQVALFEKAQKMSGLGKGAEEDAKKP